MSWAKHRRRKAAARCHLRLNLQSFLPAFAIVDTAGQHDTLRAKEFCAGLSKGEIGVFDKAYVDYKHLWALNERGVFFFVTRDKGNMACRVKKRGPDSFDWRILKDEMVVLKGHYTRQKYPGALRRVTALVEIDGEDRMLVFVSNNLELAPSTVADPHRYRWKMESFFKELKQTVQLADFLAYSANAVKWQVWIALIVHLLLRFQASHSRWAHSFTRQFTYVRAALWFERDLYSSPKSRETADGDFRCHGDL